MKALFTLLFALLTLAGISQDIAMEKFHEGSNLFINGKPAEALTSVNEGLRMDPRNEKLTDLKKLLEQEKKKQEEQQKKEQQKKEQQKKEQQKQQEQQNKSDEKKEQDKKEQEKKDQQNKDQKQEEKDQNKEQKDEEEKKKEQEKKEQKEQNKDEQRPENKEVPPEVLERLKQMKISEEKARMILEAMKNQEVQYLQQNKRKATKPKDRGKPDW